MPGYSDPGFDTLALHAGAAPDPTTCARAVPIHLTTSFVFESSEHAASLFNLERAGHGNRDGKRAGDRVIVAANESCGKQAEIEQGRRSGGHGKTPRRVQDA